MAEHVLIVDDDVDACELLAGRLPALGYRPQVAHDGEEALEALEQTDFGVVLTDLQMPRMDGLQLCREIRAARPQLPVVLVTNFHEIGNALEALRAGASDFLPKPLDGEALVACLARASRRGHFAYAMRRAMRALAVDARDGLVGTSPRMRRVKEMIAQVAATDASVLIAGETGTGKELVARAIHAKSSRAAGPFVALNCAAIPANLVESELFGHSKGAFTDAREARRGLFLEATGGTLFLDEVGDLPLEVQPKLLRALQQRTVRAVGANAETSFDTRIVAATHRDLDADVAARRFRKDLFYRINVVRIDVPALRDRGADILAIAQHLLDRMAPDENLSLSAPAADRLLAHNWPGNVRELENCIQRAVALARYPQIMTDDLPERLQGAVQAVLPASFEQDSFVTVAELERQYIQHTMKMVNGNKTRAAQVLGLDRRTLYRRLERERSAENPDTLAQQLVADAIAADPPAC